MVLVRKDSWSSDTTRTERNLLELIKRDEGINIVHHVTVLFMQSTDKKGVMREPSSDDRVIQLLLARALDDQPDRNVITGNRLVTNGSNSMKMALEVTQFGHRKVTENGGRYKIRYE